VALTTPRPSSRAAIVALAIVACRTGLPSPELESDPLTTSGSGEGAASSADGGGAPDPCDDDSDGHLARRCGGQDCDDRDPARHPGAPDTNALIGPWLTQPISPGSTALGSWAPAVAIDASSAVHIAFVEQGLEVVHNRAGSWSHALVASDATGVPSLAVDAAGTVRVAYRTSTGVFLATASADGWSVEPVDQLAIGDPSLSVHGSDEHLAYAATDGLRVATRAGASWSIATIDDAPDGAPSLALTPSGQPHIVYAAEDGALRHADRLKGYWVSELVVSSGTFGAASVAIDGAEGLHVGYSNFVAGGIFYASNSGAGWAPAHVDGQVGFRTSIAVDVDGQVHIAHDDVGQMTYATQTDADWTLEPLFFGWNGGSLAVEGSGAAHVAYSDFLFDPGNFIGHASNRVLAPDGVDQNCDGVDGTDNDGDGHASVPTGGDDCDDFVSGQQCARSR